MTEEKLDNFITDIIDADLESGKHDHVVTRFPPEPNGYLHIGHAKSICLNFGLAEQYGGECNLRFDDTNPETEDTEYVESIKRDVEWLGYDWSGEARYASSYFEQMYEFAVELIRKGKAYVDSVDVEKIREMRGTVNEPGQHSPYRDRTVEENLDLFRRMRDGEFDNGEHVLRAKIDMSADNMLMRDPLLYRIRHATHHRTGDEWCIYPMYDFAHCLEDAIEGVTHSLCTLEFENNRAIYDWLLDNVSAPARPHQYEFARLNLDFTIMSKRKLRRLVEEGHVDGWGDPRMPTITGLRRRGVTPSAIRAFCRMIGVAKTNSLVDIGKLEYCLRDDLNFKAARVMAVLDPLKVTITNYERDADEPEELEASYWPHDVPKEGSRTVPFEAELLIERADFMAEPTKKFRRLSPGKVVRLRYGYCIRCDEVVRGDDGEVVELKCTYFPDTLESEGPADHKVQGVIHWVPASTSFDAEVRAYDRLFSVPRPDADPEKDFTEYLNPESLITYPNAHIEPSVRSAKPGDRFQFERQGYFVVDSEDSEEGAPVFNRIVTLRDSWKKKQDPTSQRKSERKRKNRIQNEPTGPIVTERDIAREESEELANAYEALQKDDGLDEEDADIISGDEHMLTFYRQAIDAYASPPTVAKWLVNEVQRVRKEDSLDSLPFTARDVARLAELVETDEISATAGKTVFDRLADEGGTPDHWVEELSLRQVSDRDAIRNLLESVENDHPGEFKRLRDGEMKLVGFLIGKVMQASGGKADPEVVREAILAEANG